MIAFVAAVFFLIITPGPGVLSAAGVGAAFGFRAGVRYVAGLCIGNAFVFFIVAFGLATLVLANPVIRTILLIVSAVYLLYLAARIAFAGSNIGFIRAENELGIMAGFLLQPINPKAYAVSTTLIGGFTFLPQAYWGEILWKFLLFNLVWIPIHLAWVWFGVVLKQLNLSGSTQRLINVGMALSMLIVVALAVFSAF